MLQLTGVTTVSVIPYTLAQWSHCCGPGTLDINRTLVLHFQRRHLVSLLTWLLVFSHIASTNVSGITSS